MRRAGWFACNQPKSHVRSNNGAKGKNGVEALDVGFLPVFIQISINSIGPT
jgi:hypothetical protein